MSNSYSRAADKYDPHCGIRLRNAPYYSARDLFLQSPLLSRSGAVTQPNGVITTLERGNLY